MPEQQETIAQRNAETLARWEAYKATGEVVQHDTVMEWLESWGADNEKPCPIEK